MQISPNPNVTKLQMSPKISSKSKLHSKCHQKENVTKSKYHKPQMSPKPKCHKNANVTKTQRSQKPALPSSSYYSKLLKFY